MNSTHSSHHIKLGLIGFGTIGTGVVKLLSQTSDKLKSHGIILELIKIADLDISTPRDCDIPHGLLTQNAHEILDDPEIQIVIELIGGIEPAQSFILKAIHNGKNVVTANKALIAHAFNEIFSSAQNNNVDVGFEASVGGGIPIIRVITEGLVANQIHSIYAIINGTANYILTKMHEENKTFPDTLAEAQKLGYAEADPSYDISGLDSAHKLSILSSLAFGMRVNLDDIYTEGIDQITPLDLVFAAELGYKIKLLAIATQVGNELEVRVQPTMIDCTSLLAQVDGVYNAIYLLGNAGPTLYYGQGAGQIPTASAVLSDIVDIARNICTQGGKHLRPYLYPLPNLRGLVLKDISNIRSAYYLRFTAIDKPGVLSSISGILGKNNISISSVIQKGREEKKAVPIIMMTHEVREIDLKKALDEIDKLAFVMDKTLSVRVENF
ncbi:MAG: homoserine dehydrogenase [bacterium]